MVITRAGLCSAIVAMLLCADVWYCVEVQSIYKGRLLLVPDPPLYVFRHVPLVAGTAAAFLLSVASVTGATRYDRYTYWSVLFCCTCGAYVLLATIRHWKEVLVL